MRRTTLTAILSLLFLSPAAAAPPACQGRDILMDMKASDPKAFAEIRAAADKTENGKALLWRVEKKGEATSHLFGTMHSTDERVHKLSPAVDQARAGARKVALELAELAANNVAESMLQVKDIQRLLLYTDGRGLTAHLTPAELDKLRAVLAKSGMPAEVAHLVKPWFAWMSLALPECEQRRSAAGLAVLDQRIGQEAKKRGQPVIGLESIGDQIGSLANMPERDQVQLLKASLAMLHDNENLLEVLVQLYIARDIGAIVPTAVKLTQKAGFDPSVFAPVERNLVNKRNAVMRDAALPLLRDGGAFIAVGAAHLPGKQGLVELLRGAGYTVTAVE